MRRIRLRHAATWTTLTVIYAALAGFCAFLVVAYARHAEPILAMVGAGAAALGALAIALLFLAGARRAPSLSVVADGVVVDLPGVLRQSLHIPKHQLRHVYMRDAFDIKDDKPQGWDRFRRADVPATASRVAWLSFGALTSPSEWRLLLVVDPPIAFKDLVRRTTGVRNVADTILRQPFYLPSYSTVARAIGCEPDDLQAAVDALFAAGYPVTRPPLSDDDFGWLSGV